MDEKNEYVLNPSPSKELFSLDKLRSVCRSPKEADRPYISPQTKYILDVTLSVVNGEQVISSPKDLEPHVPPCHASKVLRESFLPQPVLSFGPLVSSGQVNLLDTTMRVHGEIISDSPNKATRPIGLYLPFEIANTNVGIGHDDKPYFVAIDQNSQEIAIPIPEGDRTKEFLDALRSIKQVGSESNNKNKILSDALHAARLEVINHSSLISEARKLISQGIPLNKVEKQLKKEYFPKDENELPQDNTA